MKRVSKTFRETGSNLRRFGCPLTSRSTENIDTVRKSVAESIGTSIRHRGQDLTFWEAHYSVFPLNLHFHAQKFQLTKKLTPSKHAQPSVRWLDYGTSGCRFFIIFILMTSIIIIHFGFGIEKIHEWFFRNKCIQNVVRISGWMRIILLRKCHWSGINSE